MTHPRHGTPAEHNPEEADRVVIRDKRRIDPVTGEAREVPAGQPAGTQAGAVPATETAQVPMVEAALLDERTADLQRLQAEYANYRKRADRERLAAGDIAVGRALAELLPVLDDIDLARRHGDLTGGLKAVADGLLGALAKLGLERVGEVGDPFDPTLHEAVTHTVTDEVTEATCTSVLRPGYRHGERLLRPAMVGVSEPPHDVQAEQPPAAAEPRTVQEESQSEAEGDQAN